MKLYKNRIATCNPHNSLVTVDVLNIGYFWSSNKIMVSSVIALLSRFTLHQETRRPIEPTETIEQLWVLP